MINKAYKLNDNHGGFFVIHIILFLALQVILNSRT